MDKGNATQNPHKTQPDGISMGADQGIHHADKDHISTENKVNLKNNNEHTLNHADGKMNQMLQTDRPVSPAETDHSHHPVPEH